MPQTPRHLSANGLRFAYYEQGSGPLVLLLHGFPDTPETWSEIQPQLAAAGYRVVAPFMRGYSPSEAPADGNYSAFQLGKDVLALIEALGESQAIVIGHDWGAFAAYAAANINPQRIHKLVTLAIPHPGTLQFNLRTLVKAPHFITFQFGQWAVARLQRNKFAEVEAIYRRWSPNWHFTDTDLAPVRLSLGAPGGVKAVLGYYWSFRRDVIDPQGAETRRLLQAPTTVPTLTFFGETDGALDQDNIDTTRKYFTGSYELVRVPVAGHFLHREAPQVFLDKTLAFIGTT
jgi:pimeloyl-ACP methyl ester carboxylesterase